MLRKKKGDFVAETGGAEETKQSTTCPAEIRLRTEFAELDLPVYTKIDFPDSSTQMRFNVTLNLTKEKNMWSGGIYQFTIEIPFNYPHEAPKAHCNTPIYHPNIDTAGNVCLNILRADWRPVLGLNSVFIGLILLFDEPNPNDPLNHEAAE